MINEENNKYKLKRLGNIALGYFVEKTEKISFDEDTVNYLFDELHKTIDDLLDGNVEKEYILNSKSVKNILKNTITIIGEEERKYSKNKIKKIFNKLFSDKKDKYSVGIERNKPVMIRTSIIDNFNNFWLDMDETDTTLNSSFFKKQIYDVLNEDNIKINKNYDSEELVVVKNIMILTNRDLMSEFITRLLTINLKEFSVFLKKTESETKKMILSGKIFSLTKHIALRILEKNEKGNFLNDTDKLTIINEGLFKCSDISNLNQYNFNSGKLILDIRCLEEIKKIFEKNIQDKNFFEKNRWLINLTLMNISNNNVYTYNKFYSLDKEVKSKFVKKIEEVSPTIFFDIPQEKNNIFVDENKECLFLSIKASNLLDDLMSIFKHLKENLSLDYLTINNNNNIFYNKNFSRILEQNINFEAPKITEKNIVITGENDQEGNFIIEGVKINLNTEDTLNFEKFFESTNLLDKYILERIALNLNDYSVRGYCPLVIDWLCKSFQDKNDWEYTENMTVKDKNIFINEYILFFNTSMEIYAELLNSTIKNQNFEYRNNLLTEITENYIKNENGVIENIELVERNLDILPIVSNDKWFEIEDVLRCNKLILENEPSFAEKFKEKVLSRNFVNNVKGETLRKKI